MFSARSAVAVAILFLGVTRADDCQPYQWKRDGNATAAAGDIVCRHTATSPSQVNYYSCSALAIKYVVQLLLSEDGFCGPSHQNSSCLGTTNQCCNSKTWTCGNSDTDCDIGICYSGACKGTNYTTTGLCGPKNGSLKCGGHWGDCCSFAGVCGTGPNFCGTSACESGNCTNPLPPAPPTTNFPWQVGTTPDGTCGGAQGYTCDVIFGNCCSKGGVCGSSNQSCGAGCQSSFGPCNFAPTPNLTILAANFGGKDVTGPVQKLVTSNQTLSLDTGAAVGLFGDPWPNNRKAILILYRWGAARPMELLVASESSGLVTLDPHPAVDPARTEFIYYGTSNSIYAIVWGIMGGQHGPPPPALFETLSKNLTYSASNDWAGFDGWPSVAKELVVCVGDGLFTMLCGSTREGTSGTFWQLLGEE